MLVGHIGQAHRWAAEIARTGEAAAVPDPHTADPGEVDHWRDWLIEGAAELVTAVRAEAPVWTFLGPRPASFWLRRMLHDAVVHHLDIGRTVGTVVEVDPVLAADGISEVLELLTAPGAEAVKPALAELRGSGQTIAVQATDCATGWRISLTPKGIRLDDSGAPADATVTGSAQELLTVFTGRSAVDSVVVRGDRALVEHWLAHTAL